MSLATDAFLFLVLNLARLAVIWFLLVFYPAGEKNSWFGQSSRLLGVSRQIAWYDSVSQRNREAFIGRGNS